MYCNFLPYVQHVNQITCTNQWGSQITPQLQTLKSFLIGPLTNFLCKKHCTHFSIQLTRSSTTVIIIIISIQPEGRFWQEPEPSQATGMALAHCILGSFLEVGCHCFPPPLDVPTFASRCLHVQATWETSISERRNYGREMAGQFSCDFDFHVNPGFFDMPRKSATWETALLPPPPQGRHAVGFFTRKIRRLRPGSNPRSWVPEASMLTTRPLNNNYCKAGHQ